MSKLMDCPFCGSPDVHLFANWSRKNQGWYVQAQCETCGARSRGYFTETDPDETDWNGKAERSATAAWNMRNQAENHSG